MDQFAQILYQLHPLLSIHAGNPSEKFPVHHGERSQSAVSKTLSSPGVWTKTGK
jgi:hypothetical protein